MIVAVSRFKVANGKEGDVARAFLARPRLVDQAPGFLGLETFTDENDPSIFYLVTRWTDPSAFRAWHSGPEHKRSHEFIPGGLKLDAAHTSLRVLARLSEPGAPPTLEEVAADGLPVLVSFLEQAQGFCLVSCAPDGTVRACNGGLSRKLKCGDLRGRLLQDVLTTIDAAQLMARVAKGERLSKDRFLLNFVDADQVPFTLRCQVDVQPGSFLLLGEPPFREEAALQKELLQLNNDLTAAHRESQRRERALDEEVTRRKAAEERLAALNAGLDERVRERTNDLARFSYTVAHDLRAPLRAISGMCHLIEEEYAGRVLDDQGADYARRAGAAARRLDLLIRDLLDYTALSRSELSLIRVDLAASLSWALRELEPDIRRTGAAVEAMGPLPAVLAHPGTLERVFLRLVSNALEFVPPGRSPRVRIRAEAAPSWVRVWVEDEGVGIPAELQAKVFEVFERLGDSRGTGMGLAYVKRAVELMGGRAGLLSEPGRGSRFFVDLKPVGDHESHPAD